jgi:hypothetical protein
MFKIPISSIVILIFSLVAWISPVSAKNLNSSDTNQIISCFSGGSEIIRKQVVAGPFADEYKFAHEVKVIDNRGEHNLNFAGGLCIIDRGEVIVKKEPKITDRLSCYSGAKQVAEFEIYGRETTVDEYVEGRTFLAKSSGNFFNSDTLHEYLVFGGGACIGEETI